MPQLLAKERKEIVYDFKLEGADLEKREIYGYAATWDLDEVDDIIEKGAFARSIKMRGPRDDGRSKIKILWQHDAVNPIGKPIEMVEDHKGLYIRMKISQTRQGDEALILVNDGVVDKMSIGFDVIQSEPRDNKSNIRRIKEVKLYEVSLVTFPANEEASILGLKAAEREKALDHLRATLKTEILSEVYPELLKQLKEELTAEMKHKEEDGTTVIGEVQDSLVETEEETVEPTSAEVQVDVAQEIESLKAAVAALTEWKENFDLEGTVKKCMVEVMEAFKATEVESVKAETEVVEEEKQLETESEALSEEELLALLLGSEEPEGEEEKEMMPGGGPMDQLRRLLSEMMALLDTDKACMDNEKGLDLLDSPVDLTVTPAEQEKEVSADSLETPEDSDLDHSSDSLTALILDQFSSLLDS
ncbi:MAG: HK97 family phage prohead protease [Candidatus Riesia sp.]|nr:HK97 family phage prohead protease [Candidatus Riesia sp.]